MNLPNALTLSRIVLSLLFMVLLLADGPATLEAALVVFLAAAVTDLWDGYAARRTGGQTAFGKFMDPLADKLLVSLALVGLLARATPGLAGWVVVVIVAREMVITGLRSLAAYRGLVIGSSRTARAKTVCQMSLVSWFLVRDTLFRDAAWLSPGAAGSPAPDVVIAGVLAAVTVLLTTVSGVEYLYRNRDVWWAALR